MHCNRSFLWGFWEGCDYKLMPRYVLERYADSKFDKVMSDLGTYWHFNCPVCQKDDAIEIYQEFGIRGQIPDENWRKECSCCNHENAKIFISHDGVVECVV